ncbi:CRAL-TRIO domain-containing protein [Dissophora ornata]|nr:hypothetical protein BGZ58_008404 [Dissophora ornata]KAI8606173.1 CRAL-TRIO domain-containing protein [Dissophora ornata]
MAKTDIPTPQGTGIVGKLTPEQKELLKQMWAELFQLLDNGEVNPPCDALTLASISASVNAETSSVKSAKKSWFGSSKNTTAVSAAHASSADEPGATLLNLSHIGLGVEDLRPSLWNLILGDHPDSLLLRFLRARKWNVTNGTEMILKAFKWRIEDNIDEIRAKSEDDLDVKYRGFKMQMEMGKSCFYGTDKQGRPVVYVNVRLHKPAGQDPKALEMFTIHVMETGRLLLQPPAETACLVFDMTGFGLSNMDYSFVKFLVQCFEAYYPESLGVLVIHKAPIVFRGVWKIIEPWLDPVVVSKIRFTRSDKELTEVIDAEFLPNKYDGGKSQYAFKYLPVVPGENDRMNDTETKERLLEEWRAVMWKFEALTREWISCKKTEGARSEEVIEAERLGLTKDIRAAYFNLDPYIRARTLYHRSEHPVIQADGSTNWPHKN